MNDDEATRYFDALGAGTDSRPALPDLMAAGRNAERRKRRRTIAASVAAVALILGGGAVVQQATAGGDGEPAPNHVAEPPSAPDGMRLVGKGRVVVAVPESWSTGATRCGEPTEATVWFPQEIDYDCPDPPVGWVPQLRIGELSSPLGANLWDRAEQLSSQLDDGTEVIETNIVCIDSFPEACSITFAVPSEDVYFVLGTPDMDDRAFVQGVRDSLQLLPEGWTTVPWVEPGTPRTTTQDLVAAAGLVPEGAESDSIAPVPGTDPDGGTVVRVGSTVTLHFPDDSGPTDQASAESPAGTRLVGMGRVVVAVPDSWTSQDTRCGQPVSATVYFPESAARSCLVVPDEPFPSLYFVGVDTREGRLITSELRAATIRNGLTVYEGSSCPDTASCVDPLPYAVEVAQEGVVVVLQGTATEPTLRETLLDSLRLLPEGFTTVPYIQAGTPDGAAQQILENAGLETVVTGDLADHRVFSTLPPAGSVVEVGAFVQLNDLQSPRD